MTWANLFKHATCNYYNYSLRKCDSILFRNKTTYLIIKTTYLTFYNGYSDEHSHGIRLLSGDGRSAVSGSKPKLSSLANTTSAAVYEHCLFILNI